MTQNPHQTPPVIPGTHTAPSSVAPVTPKRRVHPLSIILTAIGVATFLVGMILVAVSVAGPSVTAASSPSPSPVVVYVTQPGVAPVASVAVPVTTTKPPPPPAPTIDDGTWTVGVDLPAGKYRVTANVGSGCYWKITKSGTNGEDIIANDIPGGGRPTVTVKAGQDFSTTECGTWTKIG